MRTGLTRKHRIRIVSALLLLLLLAVGLVRAQGGGTIGYGSTLFGRTTLEAPQVLYSFNGTVNDLIVVKVTGYSGGIDPRVTLLGPAAQPLVVNDNAAFGTGSEAYLSAFLPWTGPFSLLVDSANGQPGDFMIELHGRGPVESEVLEFGVPVLVEIPQQPEPQFYTFEADPYCPTTLTIYDVSSGQPASFPFVVKVRDEDGIEVGMIRGGRVLENRLTVAPDGDPNPGTEMYEVEVTSADPLLQGSLVLVITCADQIPACPGADSGGGAVPTSVPTIDPNGTPTLIWTPTPFDEPCPDPLASPTPGIRLIPIDPILEIAGSDDATPEVTGEAPAGVGLPEPNKNLTEVPLLEPLLPDPPSIAVLPSATPTPAMMPTPCPTPTDQPCVEPTPRVRLVPADTLLEVPDSAEMTPTTDLPLGGTAEPAPDSAEEARPLIVAQVTATPTTPPRGTPCPTVTPTATPTLTATPTRPPTVQQDCSGFAMTSPTDGLPNGGITVYWNPVPWATSYRVNVYGEGGGLLLSVEVAAPASNVGIDVSVGSIGPGFVFTVQVQALQGGVVRCSDGRTLFRESPGGDPGGDPGDDPRDDPEENPTPCVPAITHVNCF